MDEVGSNTSQKGDGHVGGKNFICGKEYIPCLKSSKKDWTYHICWFSIDVHCHYTRKKSHT